MVVNMDILIIHLNTATERLDFQNRQFKQLNLAFEIVEARSVSDISEESYQSLGFGWQRPLRKVEVACFFKSSKSVGDCFKKQKPCLILEDDAVLAKHVPELLRNIENADFQDIDLINLEIRSRKKIISKAVFHDFQDSKTKLFKLYQDRTGAAGYILYPSGAQKLLDRLAVSAPAIADGFIFSHYGLKSLQAEPAAIIQEDQMVPYGLVPAAQFDSIIGRSEHFKPEYASFNEKFKFKQRRLAGQIAMAFRYIQVIAKAEKRFIKLDKKDFI